MRIMRRLLFWFQQRRQAADLAEEMEFHRQMIEQETGDPQAATRRMGAAMMAAENARAEWLPVWLESIFQDLRYAWRSLIARPGFTALALLALSLGIGLNTSLFAAFNAVALRPWPVRDPGRVVNLLGAEAESKNYSGFSAAEYRYIREHTRTLEGVIFMRNEHVNLDRQTNGYRSVAHFVSGNYFSVLGVDMALGRSFADDEDRLEAPAAVAVLSYRAWQSRYAGDLHIIGRRILINDAPFTVVGVASAGFTGLSPEPHDLWAPASSLQLVRPNDPWTRTLLTDPHWCCSDMAGRLAPDATKESAQSELTLLSAQFQKQVGQQAHNVVAVGTAFFGRPDKKAEIVAAMALIMAAVGSILLLACANVSNLLLARAAARQREIAVRLAIGAGRFRIVRQLLTESLLLAVVAGGLGLLLAWELPGFVVSKLVLEELSVNLQPDSTVLAYTLGIAIFSAVAFGLVPALRGTEISVSDAMKQQSALASPRFPLRGLLLAVQVAISVVLLVGASVLLRGLSRAHNVDPGFQTSGVTLLGTELPLSAYDDKRGEAFFKDLTARIRPYVQTASGTTPVGLAGLLPLGNTRDVTGFTLPGQQGTKGVQVLVQPVNAAYFDALGIPIIAGRNFIPADRDNSAILVNETMAKRFFPGGSPIGQAIITGKRREIVGVVRDAQVYGLGPVEPIMFVPFDGGQHAVIVVRGGDGTPAWRRQMAEMIKQEEPHVAVSVVTMQEQMESWLAPMRSGATIAAVLGTLALLLATVGVYGVIAYSVEQRRKEIGVRMALGAKPRQIVWFIAKSNSRALLSGLAAGLILSLGVAEILRTQLFGITRLDPVAYGGVLLLLFAAGVAASVVPARRAAGIAPLEALHYE